MCGFIGLLGNANVGAEGPEHRRAAVRRGLQAIRHRGPDEQAFFDDEMLSFGFARLAIVDLECGRQPMANEDGSLWLVFNGEIYNHLELRRELAARGHRFKTDHSDSEVLLHGWEEWGPDLLPRLNGMFAFLLWDQRARELVAARDRFGVKPLYSARRGGQWVFASEIKALLASGLVAPERDDQAVAEYLLRQNTWGARTFFRGVEEFPKGALWRVREGEAPRVQVYWRAVHSRDAKTSYEDAVEEHRSLLARAVRTQMMADVPVMSYLSGGIDSSAITALATHTRKDVSAYACLFDLAQVGADRVVDEREFSRAAAGHLHVPLVELELAPTALSSTLDATIRALETPRMGMAYVNYLIAGRVARDGKVVLSGTGGDEFHGGYVGRYAYVAAASGEAKGGGLRRMLPAWLAPRAPSDDWHSRARTLLNYPVPRREMVEALDPGFLERVDLTALDEEQQQRLEGFASLGPVGAMLAMDSETYLHGLLVMEDKLSMAHSLEARVPLLDNGLVDFLLSLPLDYLHRGGVGKSVFRDSVAPLLPREITNKPKMGFGPPDASWYRGPLRGFVEERVLGPGLEQAGIFRPGYLRGKTAAHMSGQDNQVPLLWSALSLESWHRAFTAPGARIA